MQPLNFVVTYHTQQDPEKGPLRQIMVALLSNVLSSSMRIFNNKWPRIMMTMSGTTYWQNSSHLLAPFGISHKSFTKPNGLSQCSSSRQIVDEHCSELYPCMTSSFVDLHFAPSCMPASSPMPIIDCDYRRKVLLNSKEHTTVLPDTTSALPRY